MTCLVSTKRKEIDGSKTVLVTCLSCGYSVRADHSFTTIICLSCGSKLHKTPYLTEAELKERIEELKKQLQQELNATAQTVISGFSAAKPFVSYRKNKKRFKRISALPTKIINNKNKQ